jgi:ribosomal protein S18 acetylase RimI-like enzyme
MGRDRYSAYADAAVTGYAHDNIAAGRWERRGAVERARADFEFLLPHGLDTPDNFLFEILAGDDGPVVGFAWLAIERKYGPASAYLYDIGIDAAHRRRGHGMRALRALEDFAAGAGATSIGLNVFANNGEAQSLYQKLGYAPTNFNMRKRLR